MNNHLLITGGRSLADMGETLAQRLPPGIDAQLLPLSELKAAPGAASLTPIRDTDTAALASLRKAAATA